MISFPISSPDDVHIKAYAWLTKEKPLAVLQIAHGMQEHALRYDHFARWLNEKGIAVYAEDHIGHGASVDNMDEIAHFPGKDDWQRQVDLLHVLNLRIKEDYPGVPVYLLGHSMGSVLVQTYMIRYGQNTDGYILTGAISQPCIMALLGQSLATLLSLLFGSQDRSELIIKLGYGQYNKHFKPNRTGADWLCSNTATVDEYIASPLCGVPLTNMFYRNFFYGFRYVSRPRNLKKMPAFKPILILAGNDDPAGFFGKAPGKIKKLIEKYSAARAKMILYPGFRHEILNERNREDVYKDILELCVGRRA